MKIKKRRVVIIIAVILGTFSLLYLCGAVGQIMANYAEWTAGGGITGNVLIRPVDWNLFR